MPLRTLAATRHLTPLREDGSMLAIVEAGDAAALTGVRDAYP